ncbi:MAG: RNA polymerase sigma factor RpoD/SigA [Myxococcales bacterium]
MRNARNFEGVSAYLSSVGRHKQLTREEEVELANLARKGDQRAKDRLVVSNLPLVISVAKKYMNRGARLDDLIQEGNVGLLKAVGHYDPKKGTRFATYAVWWIRAYIQRFLHDNRSQVRGGESERGPMSDLSLDITIDEESELTHLDRLEDDGPSPEVRYAAREQDVQVRDALNKVKKRLGGLGWDILEERLTQDSPQTLEDLGKKWGVSRERVRQVELKTKVFLERYLEPIAA